MPLADNHVHFLGCYTADMFMHLARTRAIDWTAYEDSFELAYGAYPNLRPLLRRLAQTPAHHHDESVTVKHELRDLFQFGSHDAGNFPRFQAKFNAITWSSNLSDPHLRKRMTRDFLAEIEWAFSEFIQQWREQELHAVELHIMLPPHWPDAVRHQALSEFLNQCQRHSSSDCMIRIAVSLHRDHPFSDWAMVKDLSLSPLGRYLTAIDFCHIEEGKPPKQLRKICDAVHQFNHEKPQHALAILLHVGESYADKSLESAIRWVYEAAFELKAHRLGHGIALAIDPMHHGEHDRHELVSERLDHITWELQHHKALRQAGIMVDQGALTAERKTLQHQDPAHLIHIQYTPARLKRVRALQDWLLNTLAAAPCWLEVCPSSNLRIAGITNTAHHPIHRLQQSGVKYCIGSDDPGLFGITLREELQLASSWLQGNHGNFATASWQARSEIVSGRATAEGR